YVIRGNEVWMTKDVTNLSVPENHFINITGNLVNLGGGGLTAQLRTITLFDNSSSTAGDSVVLVGGLGGVFRLDSVVVDASGTVTATWSKFGDGLPNVMVKDVQFIDDDPDGNKDNGTGLLLAGTGGRGAWTISNVSLSVLGPPPVLKVTGSGDADTIKLIRNAADPTMLDVQVTNAAGTESKSFPLANITQIQVHALGPNDTLVVDSSNGIIKVPGGILYPPTDPTPPLPHTLPAQLT